MPKTIIQVPMDEELLEKLNRWCKKDRKARAEVIRQACAQFLKTRQIEEWDREYEEAYRRIPETGEIAQWQMAVLKDVWPDEEW